MKGISAVDLRNITQLLIINVSVYHQCIKNIEFLSLLLLSFQFPFIIKHAEIATQFSPGQSETAPRYTSCIINAGCKPNSTIGLSEPYKFKT